MGDMEAIIFHDDDSITIQGRTIEELRDTAFQELAKRGWKEDDCWSEVTDSKEQRDE